MQIPLGRGFAGRVAAERRAITIADVDHADILNPILREKGIRSLLGVPLLVQGRVIGVLHVGSLTPREFSDDDRDLLQLAADRAALAIAQAQLYTRERDAREAAELITRQLRAVQKVTDATLAYLPEEELLQELLQRVSDILAVDTVAILLLEGDRLHARAAKGIEEEVEQGVQIPLGRGFAGRIAAEKRAITIADVDHADILNPILREKGIKSLLGVPLLVQGRVIGVLHVGSLTPREFTDDDRDLLQLAADRAALGIEQARLYAQRRVAEAVQQRLLPPEISDRSGLEGAARYLPAAGASLGGDWYDVFPLVGGRVAVAVGDVVGHGIEAAAVMAQLRTAVRAYAAEGHTPGEVVDRVNNLMLNLGPLAMTTMVYLVIDPATESLELVNAGHPPALRRRSLRRGPLPVAERRRPARRHRGRDLQGRALPAPHRRDRPDLHRRARRAPRRVDRGRPRAAARDRQGRARPRVPVRDDLRAARARGARGRRGVHRHPRAAAGRSREHHVARDAGQPRADPLPPPPLADEPRGERAAGLRHHRRRPGGVRERHRARLRPGARGVRGRPAVGGRPGDDHGDRPRPVAAAAGREPRPRPPAHAHADGRGRRAPHRRRHLGDADQHAGVTVLANITGELRGSMAIAHVDGEIDASNVVWVEERIRMPLTNRCDGLAVDLTGTTYLDSAGIAMLFRLAAELRQHQQQLRLVLAEGSPIARMASLSGLEHAVPTHTSLEAALE